MLKVLILCIKRKQEFVSDMVGNPEARFSHIMAHMVTHAFTFTIIYRSVPSIISDHLRHQVRHRQTVATKTRPELPVLVLWTGRYSRILRHFCWHVHVGGFPTITA